MKHPIDDGAATTAAPETAILVNAQALPVDFHAKLTHHFHRILTHPGS